MKAKIGIHYFKEAVTLRNYLILALTLLILCITNVFAENDPAELHYSIVQGTGVNGINLPEVSLPDSNFNPASLPWAEILNYKGSAMILSGGISTEGGSMSMNMQSVSNKIGNLFFKVSLYQTDCSSIKFLATSALAGTETNFNIKASELQVAYPLSKNLFAGAALVFNEDSNFNLRVSEPNLPLYSASSHAPTNYRLGLEYLPSEKVSVGLVYSYRNDVINATYFPALTMMDANINSILNYYTGAWTAGFSWQIGTSTTLFYNHQFMSTSGPYGMVDYNYAYFGLQQNLSKNFYVRVASNDGAPEIQLNYVNKNFFFGGYYSEGSKQFEPLVGKPKRLLLWTGITF